jgi:pimeloyl-ACP methyl ester carboxylesterase
VEGGWSWAFDPQIFVSAQMEPEDLAAIACDVSLVRGERGMATTDITESVAEILGGHVPVTLVPDAGHHIMFDQPIALIALLQALIGQWRP